MMSGGFQRERGGWVGGGARTEHARGHTKRGRRRGRRNKRKEGCSNKPRHARTQASEEREEGRRRGFGAAKRAPCTRNCREAQNEGRRGRGEGAGGKPAGAMWPRRRPVRAHEDGQPTTRNGGGTATHQRREAGEKAAANQTKEDARAPHRAAPRTQYFKALSLYVVVWSLGRGEAREGRAYHTLWCAAPSHSSPSHLFFVTRHLQYGGSTAQREGGGWQHKFGALWRLGVGGARRVSVTRFRVAPQLPLPHSPLAPPSVQYKRGPHHTIPPKPPPQAAAPRPASPCAHVKTSSYVRAAPSQLLSRAMPRRWRPSKSRGCLR